VRRVGFVEGMFLPNVLRETAGRRERGRRPWKVAGFLLLAAACAETQSHPSHLPPRVGPLATLAWHEDSLLRTLGAPKARFNEIQQKATHNSYVRDETIFDELVYHRVRALEFDLHADRVGLASAPKDWFVYHMFSAPYSGTQCVRMSDCLRVVKTFHDTFPQHEVVTLWLDLKDNFSANGHDVADLDSAIVTALGDDVIFRPRDLMAACPNAKSLRDAVAGTCAWPETKDLRGKILVALTGATACSRGSSLDRYLGGGHFERDFEDRTAFIAPDLNSTCTFEDSSHRQDVVLFNANGANAWRTEDVHRAGLVSRVYAGGMGGGLDDPLAWNAARAHRANFLATDRVNAEVDPWASTETKTGWPFLCLLVGCEPSPAEEREIVGVSAQSGDIDGTNDSFYFLESDRPSAELSSTWSAAIAVPSSNVERWAKGCLMARATRDADSPYVAVCRPADNSRIRVQYRLTKGGTTVEMEAPRPPGLSAESTFFARLELTTSQDGTTATSSASTDGINWAPIATRAFSTLLPHQGLAASSHGSDAVRFLFANLKRGAEIMGTKSFDEGHKIGSALRGSIFRGAAP